MYKTADKDSYSLKIYKGCLRYEKIKAKRLIKIQIIFMKYTRTFFKHRYKTEQRTFIGNSIKWTYRQPRDI